jgi:hypothetical protein
MSTDRPGRIAGGTPEPLRDISPDKLARVKGLYGRVLTDDEVRQIAMIETEYHDEVHPWEVYPGIGPNPVFYARRRATRMRVLVAQDIPSIYLEIQKWASDHEHDAWEQS